MSQMFKHHHNPFKALYPLLLLMVIGAGIVLIVFAFSWLSDNIYTVIWIILVLACLLWLGDTIYQTIKNKTTNFDQDTTQFPSEKYEG